MSEYYSLTEVADYLSVSKETLRRWDKNGKLKPTRLPNNYRVYTSESLKQFEALRFLFDNEKHFDSKLSEPLKNYRCIELFAGAGGLALGFEKAGITSSVLNEVDSNACNTLRINRPDWNIIQNDIRNISFKQYANKIDIVSGGFPCQAFSYAGKKLGFEDARGTLFYEFARVVKEVQPLICIGENVRGLLNHDSGRTIDGMKSVLNELGYDVFPPRVLKAIFYRVPQKRERLFLIGIRKGSGITFEFPLPYKKIYTVKDALKSGELYHCDVPDSPGQKYPKRKREILSLVPQGGYWKDLPEEVQKEYMLKSFYLSGGKTGIARRMSWNEPCLTLTCSPAQKQTERCHPDETRPFTVREYARIQTFPDDWKFSGSLNQIYKQIGNAVPVNLAYEVGRQLVKALNEYTIKEELKNKLQQCNCDTEKVSF